MCNFTKLAELAHKALNSKDTEYARNKTRIAQFFDTACALANKEVRLTLIDSLYSTNVEARRLFGISHIAGQLCSTFPGGDNKVKEEAEKWIENDFDDENSLCAIFTAKYGCNKKEGKETKTAPALLSKYLYFVTGCAFPIYNKSGAEYYYLAGKEAPRRPPKDAQERFRVMKKILLKTGIKDFDQLDAFFWLYSKVQEANFSSALNQERYAELTSYKGEKTIEEVVKEIRKGVLSVENADTLRDILGADLYTFIQQTANLD